VSTSVNFPTLSRSPTEGSFVESLVENPTLSSTMDDGTVITRAKHTLLKRKWQFRYNFLVHADKVLLETLQATVMVGAGTFNWTYPVLGKEVSIEVRLTEGLQFRLEPNNSSEWECSLVLQEI